MRAFIVQGLAFGDEGKGASVDYLVRRESAPLVVRYNGGPQAAHNVVTAEGVHHTFSQFGAGTLAGARTHLSQFMLVEPFRLLNEASYLEARGITDPMSRITVHPAAVVITPYHRAANRLRERLRGSGRHGSVGLGVGEARNLQLNYGIALRAGHLQGERAEVLATLRDIRAYLLAECVKVGARAEEEMDELQELSPEDLTDALIESFRLIRLCGLPGAWYIAGGAGNGEAACVFEGAQGFLLDETWGFAPYNTWTDCTFENAERMLRHREMVKEVRKIGVFRSYFTRHGPGPFPSEDVSIQFPEQHNGTHAYMGAFRQGWFDMVLARFAARICKPDELFLTHMDRWVYLRHAKLAYSGRGAAYLLSPLLAPATRRFDSVGGRTAALSLERPVTEAVASLPAALGSATGIPVTATAYGCTASDWREESI